jgi:hypothetical protein
MTGEVDRLVKTLVARIFMILMVAIFARLAILVEVYFLVFIVMSRHLSTLLRK